MREIKFRAWDEENKVMIYNVAINGEKPIRPGYQWFSTENTVHNSQPMQYTGLLDKNGREIYEGDIVTSASPELIFQVVYKSPSFCRKWIDDVSKRHHDPIEPMAWNTHIVCEVIGNIYEHPHLLSGGSP